MPLDKNEVLFEVTREVYISLINKKMRCFMDTEPHDIMQILKKFNQEHFHVRKK